MGRLFEYIYILIDKLLFLESSKEIELLELASEIFATSNCYSVTRPKHRKTRRSTLRTAVGRCRAWPAAHLPVIEMKNLLFS